MAFKGFKVNVKLKEQAVKALTQAQIQAAGMTAEQLLHEVVSAQVIPFDVGTTQNVGTYVDVKGLQKGEIAIVHNTPYAQKIYYHPEYNFQTTTNKNARGLWWEDWITGHRSHRPFLLYKEFYKRVSGGFVE